jgi:argininosuccinate lyase
MPLKAYRAIDARFEADLYEALDFRRAVERRDVPCGTSTRAVRAQIEKAKTLLRNLTPLR